MSEQPLDVKAFARLVWRSRLMVAGLATVGFACGIAHVVTMPAPPTARVLVTIPPTSLTTAAGALEDDTPTQIIIATSTPVLAAAGAAVSPPWGPGELKSLTAVTALSPEILQFQVSAPQAAEAEKLANAEATGYIAYINKSGSGSGTGVNPALQVEASNLTKQIEDLQNQINAATARLAAEGASSSAGQRDASLIESVRSEQEDVSVTLNNVNNQIVSTQLSGTLSAGATRVLQPATIVPASKLDLVLYPVIGILMGLFAGCLFVVVRSRHDHRLRLRDELAAAIGVPVLASFEGAACKSAGDWKRLLVGFQPSPVDSWNLRRLLHRLMPTDPDQGTQLNIVGFANDGPSLAVGVRLAKTASALGIRTELLVGSHPALGLLRAATSTLARASASEGDTFRFEPSGAGREFSTIQLKVSVVAVDDVKPIVPVSDGASLLAVSSGFATAETLARVALAGSEAGHALDGIVIVNPDPVDSTAGVVPLAGETRQAVPYNLRRAGTDRALGMPR